VQASKPTAIKLDIAADLHKWRAFVAIAEVGSVSRAAFLLDTNQALLSRQLNALERSCGARLFNRTGRGVELSETGRRIFPQVKSLLSDAMQLELGIRGEALEPSGLVTIGSLPSIAYVFAGRLFTTLRSEYPGVQLKILEGSSGLVDEWLADGRADIGILYRYGTSLPENEQALATVDSYLIGCAGDRLTESSEVPFRALDELPFILPSRPNGLRNALEAIAKRERITLSPVIEADSLPLMNALVADEGLYTVLPLHAVWAEVQQGRLQAARLVEPPLPRWLAIITAKSKGPSKAVRAVTAQITRIVDDLARTGLWRTVAGA
jgi:DNA-binding transcriptional LysR family regulator